MSGWKLSQGQAIEPAAVTSGPSPALPADSGPRSRDGAACGKPGAWLGASQGTSPFLQAGGPQH